HEGRLAPTAKLIAVGGADCGHRHRPRGPCRLPVPLTGAAYRSSTRPTFWNSLRSRYPHLAIARFNPPNRFSPPSGSSDGPYSSFSIDPSGSPATPNAPRGSFGWLAAACHQAPPPGASAHTDSGSPSITASAPQPSALAMSPEVRIPPSAIRWTYRPPVSSR